MEEMTGRERVMAALNGKECDRLCWSPLIDNYFTSSMVSQGFQRTDWADAYRLIGADIIDRHTPTIHYFEDDKIVRTITSDGSREVELIETPVGNLTIERSTNPWEASEHVTRFPIHTVADIHILEYMVEHTHHRENYAAFREHDQRIGEGGIATTSSPMTPLMDFMENLCGIQNTYFLLADHPTEMQACLGLMQAKNNEAYQLIAQGPEVVVICYEDTSSTILSPRVFRQYCAPALNEYAEICHAAGKLFLTHMCGKLSAFNSQLKTGLQDGIESICPPSTGDIWAREARAAWGPEKILFGGLEPASLERMTVAETTAYVTNILDQMPTFRRFILGTGDATAHSTPVANLRAVSEVVLHYSWK
jgi:uroporphyrinogen-III decarboxylase